MSIGFRKSLFGFNCDDVMAYIEEKHKEYHEKETLLNEKLDDTVSELNKVNEQKRQVEEALKEYTDKYDEIERLSQNIGKLYLVAQANAQSVMKTADDNRKESDAEVSRNISSIEEAHRSLEELKEKLTKSSSDFADELSSLLSSLNETKSNIERRNEETAVDTAEAENIVMQLSK